MRALVLGLAALAITGCAYGRSATELRTTAFGRRPDPPGSALAAETYTPSAWNIDGPICAELRRTYASNDADGFLQTVLRMGREHHAQYVIGGPRPIFDEDLPGYSPGAEISTVDGAIATVDFHDLDDPDYRGPGWIDARAWRFVIELRITDVSGCHL